MIFALVAAVVCLAVATIMYTPALRRFPFYQPVSFYFLFEGVCALANGIISAVFPYSQVMDVVHSIGVVVLGGYFCIRLILYCTHEKRSAKENGDSSKHSEE